MSAESSEKKYVPVALSSFIGGKACASDVFVKIEDEKYVKVLKKGQSFDRQRLERYSGNKISTVYLLSEEYGAYVESCIQMAALVQDQTKLTPTHRYAVLNKISESVFNEIAQSGLSEKSFQTSQAVITSLLTNLDSNTDLNSILASLDQIGEDFIRHSFAVGTYATMLAHQMKWKGVKTLKLLGLAGVFHDIGFKELPPEVANKRRADMSAKEVKLYETHPERGVKILTSIPGMPPEVIAAVFDHHEESGGSGFPRKLKFDRIYPLSRIINFADQLANLSIRSAKNPKPVTPAEAVKQIELLGAQAIKPEYLNALYELVGIDAETASKKRTA